MKITRRGAIRDHGTTTLLELESEPELRTSGLEFRFNHVVDPYDSTASTHHDYSVTLSPEDLRKIVAMLLVDTYYDTE